MASTVIIEEHGGSDKLILSNRKIGAVGPGQVRLCQKFAGLNFIDIYQRSGLYQLPLPSALGMEGSGVVEEVGEGVKARSSGHGSESKLSSSPRPRPSGRPPPKTASSGKDEAKQEKAGSAAEEK